MEEVIKLLEKAEPHVFTKRKWAVEYLEKAAKEIDLIYRQLPKEIRDFHDLERDIILTAKRLGERIDVHQTGPRTIKKLIARAKKIKLEEIRKAKIV